MKSKNKTIQDTLNNKISDANEKEILIKKVFDRIHKLMY